MKNATDSLIGVELNMYIALNDMTLTILIISIYEYEISFYLFVTKVC